MLALLFLILSFALPISFLVTSLSEVYILVCATIFSFIFFFRLEETENPCITGDNFLWSLFCFGAFCWIAKLLVYSNYGVPAYFVGILVAGIFGTVLYSVIPYLSYYIGLAFEWKYAFGLGYNGFALNAVLTILLSFSTLFFDTVRLEKHADNLFEKATFVPTKFLYEEDYAGTHYFVLQANQDTVFVPSFDYPEVRQVNDTSQVRYVKLGGKLKRFEIRN